MFVDELNLAEAQALLEDKDALLDAIWQVADNYHLIEASQILELFAAYEARDD